MISFKARAEMLGRTENELRSEMAASLGRISGTLTDLIQALFEIRNGYSASPEQIRQKKEQQYGELHAKARLYYWYLVVQREAIGIRNHDSLPQLYPIPDRTLS